MSSKLVILPDDVPYSEEIAKWGVAQIGNLITSSPAGSGALLLRVLVEMTYEETGIYLGMYGLEYSRGGGGPSAQTQSPPSSKKSRQARASARGGKSGAPARASTQGSRHRRESCPKGYYWSYKKKKCLKSKFK